MRPRDSAGEPDPLKTPRAAFWRRRARFTALRHNLGRALGEFLPFCLGASAVFACALLIVRKNEEAGQSVWTAYGVGLLLCAGLAVWRSRKAFFSVRDALVRLEWQLKLHNRLSAAAAGVGEFPPAQAAPDGYALQWRKIAPPLTGAAALVGLAALVPVAKSSAKYLPPTPPPAWRQTAEWIDALKKTDALQEPPLEDLRERLEELRKQPAQDWFSQSSLEAGDNLREQTAQSMQALQRDMRSMLSNLDYMQHFADQTSAAEMKATSENLDNALKGLEMGNLPLNRDLLGQLKSIKDADLSKLKALDPKKLEELKRRLKEGSGVCQACLHPGEMEGKLDALALIQGKPQNPAAGTDNDGPAPMEYNEKGAKLDTKSTAAMSNPNMDNALPGDLMGVGKGEHKVDPAQYTGLTAAGSVASNGQGGEAVWRDDLTPKEREILKNYFK